MRSRKVGVVLGAGGARGFCHIGVIEVLQENKIPIDIITGCSMGALVGGGIASGVSTADMRRVASRVTNRTVFDIDIRNFFRNLRTGGLARGNRAMKLFKQSVGPNQLIENCPIKFAAIATDLRSHELFVFKSGKLSDAVRASISIPVVFKPVIKGEQVLVDGGVLKRMPISEARDLGAEFIIAVDAVGSPNELQNTSSLGIFDISYESMDWRSARNEGRDADVLILPDMGAKSSMQFKNNIEAIEAGREATKKAIPQIKRLLNLR